MQPGGALAGTFGWLVGVGPGAGFGLLIVLCGVGGALVGLSGYIVKEIRNLDVQIPDYQVTQPVIATSPSMPILVTSESSQQADTSLSRGNAPDTTSVESVSNAGETEESQP